LVRIPGIFYPSTLQTVLLYPLLIFITSLLIKAAIIARLFRFEYTYEILGSFSTLGIILSVTWFLIVTGLKIIKNRMILKYDVSSEDNLRARKIYTQFMILENIIVFIIIILAIGIAL
jgi:hypothetical protein